MKGKSMSDLGARRYWALWAFALVVVAGLSGCATNPANPDPYEKMNRFFYGFNGVLDRVAGQPLSSLYVKITPEPVRKGLGNAFDNLDYFDVVLNDLLQGKLDQTGQDAARFVINSTLGVAGILDLATGMGLKAHKEDFGQTLAVWGIEDPGPYLMLPVFGPTTVRDAPGVAMSAAADPLLYIDAPIATITVSAVQAIDERARAEEDIQFVKKNAVDGYEFTRKAYLQNRVFLIYDGNPPPSYYENIDDFESDLDEDLNDETENEK